MRSLCRGLIYVNKNRDNLSHHQDKTQVIDYYRQMHSPFAQTLKKWLLIATLTGLPWLAALSGSPPEMEQARALTLGCQGCHGESGEGQGSLPALRTLDRESFIERFQSFTREDQSSSVMHRIARGFTADEIRLMADLLSKGESRP